MNPTGANPTGTTLTTERKRELYKLAQEYDLIILEDDAYFYLHFLEVNSPLKRIQTFLLSFTLILWLNQCMAFFADQTCESPIYGYRWSCDKI